MSNSTNAAALRPNRPLLVGAVLITALVTAWLFVPTMLGHIATMNVGSVDASATEYTVTDGGEHLSVTFELRNPTGREIVFYNGQIHAYDGETQLTDGTTTSLGGVSVPAGETVTVTAKMDLKSERTATAKRAADSGSIEVAGTLRGEIGDKEVSVAVKQGSNR